MAAPAAISAVLLEIRIVTFPAGYTARVGDVKQALVANGKLPTLPEFEKFLREAGFSKTQAAAVAGHGLTKLLRSESADAEEAASVSRALATLNSLNI